MGNPAVQVCRTSPGQSQGNTLALCWCQGQLQELINNGKLEKILKEGAKGEDVQHLHEHLQRFGFDLDLKKTDKHGKIEDSEDLKKHQYGKYCQRAVRMFALHPKVGDSDAEHIIKVDGKKLTQAIAEKIQQWCRDGTQSPANYWEFRGLKLDGKEQQLDAFGDDQEHGKQDAWHHHVRQVQVDLSQIGFGVHNDKLCEIGKQGQPTGHYKKIDPDRDLHDLHHLVSKFQTQAKWLWRMDQEGKHLPDIAVGDPSHYAGPVNGVMDADTAKVLHAWVDKKLHMVMKKFELKELHWPPDSTTVIINEPVMKPAKLRADAYDAFLTAARSIYAKNGALGKRFASAPRFWTGGKPDPGAASPYSYHYTALAVDIDEGLMAGDGSIAINAHHAWRYILEEEGLRFRLWCWVDPQPPKPTELAHDGDDAYVKYRNRNIAAKSAKPGRRIKAADPTDPQPLFHMTTSFTKVAAPEGWYLDLSKIMEENNFMRIPRHPDWKTNPKGWEWWHYQFNPPRPPGAAFDLTFGEYLQLFGVHEHKLRAAGWSKHADIKAKIG